MQFLRISSPATGIGGLILRSHETSDYEDGDELDIHYQGRENRTDGKAASLFSVSSTQYGSLQHCQE